MDNYIYEKLNSYFNLLEEIGYIPYNIVDVLVGIICLNDLNEQEYE